MRVEAPVAEKEVKDFKTSEVGKLLASPEEEVIQKEKENLESSSTSSIFVLHYRAKFKPDQGHIRAATIQEAKDIGYKYCQRWNLKYISVTPFFLDLEQTPSVRETP